MSYKYESIESIQELIDNLRYDDGLRVHAFVGEMISIIKRYGSLSFGDLLQLFDTWVMFYISKPEVSFDDVIRPIRYTDHDLIWTSAENFAVKRDKDGYRICIPWNEMKKEVES